MFFEHQDDTIISFYYFIEFHLKKCIYVYVVFIQFVILVH